MKVPIPPSPDNRSAKAIRLQEALYSSRNPTRRWLHQSRRQWLAEAVSRHRPHAENTVVEAGSGSNPLLAECAGQYRLAVSLDKETALLQHARQEVPGANRLTFLCGDIRGLPFGAGQVDLVICSEVLEHIPDATACLQEFSRILKPGGTLILTTPQRFSLLEMVARLALRKSVIWLTRVIYREPVLPTGHINLMTSGDLAQKVEAAGFTILEIHKSGLYLPGLAEIPLPASQKIAARLNTGLAGTILDFLLWTQGVVAEKKATPR